jgi:hypothetical protein
MHHAAVWLPPGLVPRSRISFRSGRDGEDPDVAPHDRETRHGPVIDTAHHVGNATAGLAAIVRRSRELGVLGMLRRLLDGRHDRDAAAYEEAAREAFKAGTPTDVPSSAPSVDVAGSRDARTPGRLAEAARREEATTAKRPGSLGSDPTEEAPGLAVTPADEPSMQDRRPDLKAPEAAGPATDLLRAPTSVTPVADDFFDGLIRRVEGKG